MLEIVLERACLQVEDIAINSNEEIQNFALQQKGRRRRAEYDDGVPRIKIPSPAPNTTY